MVTYADSSTANGKPIIHYTYRVIQVTVWSRIGQV